MTDHTALDAAHAAMTQAETTQARTTQAETTQAETTQAEDQKAQLGFYECLAASELFVLLDEESEGETIKPTIFPVEGQSFVLAFDTEARLAEFAGRTAAYAALSGRALVGMLAPQGLGLGLNLDVAASQMLLPNDNLTWMAQTLAQGPNEMESKIREVRPPGTLPESLLTGLDSRLASAAGLAENAYLSAVVYENGADGHLLGIIDALPGAEAALAQSVSEVLQFSGLEAAALDVAFFRATDPVSARLARVGLRFDLPKPPAPESATISPPGMDPDKPPRLT